MKIAILVDLELSEKSGGHVKFWERISNSLRREELDLSLVFFFLGKEKKKIYISKNITFKINKPIFSTKILNVFGIDADYTDLAPFNLSLLFQLRGFDIIHTTDQLFTMSKTAKIASRLWKIPLTTSYHTHAPSYSKHYITKILKKFPNIISTFLVKKLDLPEKISSNQKLKIIDYFKISELVFANKVLMNDFFYNNGNLPFIELKRGIEKHIFRKIDLDKKKILKKHSISFDKKIILFCGRIHELKGAILLSEVHALLKKRGHEITTIMSGENHQGDICKRIAGNNLIILDYQSPESIATLMNICDLFVFPSLYETGPQVVLEAKACNAVCVVSPNGGGNRIKKNFFDGVIISKYDSKEWANVISNLLNNPLKIKQIKENLSYNNNQISWKEVFYQVFYDNWKKIIKK